MMVMFRRTRTRLGACAHLTRLARPSAKVSLP